LGCFWAKIRNGIWTTFGYFLQTVGGLASTVGLTPVSSRPTGTLCMAVRAEMAIAGLKSRSERKTINQYRMFKTLLFREINAFFTFKKFGPNIQKNAINKQATRI